MVIILLISWPMTMFWIMRWLLLMCIRTQKLIENCNYILIVSLSITTYNRSVYESGKPGKPWKLNIHIFSYTYTYILHVYTRKRRQFDLSCSSYSSSSPAHRDETFPELYRSRYPYKPRKWSSLLLRSQARHTAIHTRTLGVGILHIDWQYSHQLTLRGERGANLSSKGSNIGASAGSAFTLLSWPLRHLKCCWRRLRCCWETIWRKSKILFSLLKINSIKVGKFCLFSLTHFQITYWLELNLHLEALQITWSHENSI